MSQEHRLIVADLLDRLAGEDPALPVLRDTRIQLTAAEAAEACARLAAVLKEFGLRARDRLLIVSENDVATPLLALAAQKLGAWPALANARVGIGELTGMRNRVRPRLIVHAVAGSPAAMAVAQGRTVTEWIDPAAGLLLVERGGDDVVADEDGHPVVALLLFTSGTTGNAKAVMWSHEGLLALGRVLAKTRATTRSSTVQCAAPLSHMMGVSNWMAALTAGANLNLMPRLDPAALVAAIEAGEITHLSLVPAAYRRLCDHLDSTCVDLRGKGLAYISCGGAPLDQSLKSRIEDRLGVRLVNGYGMTECAPGSRTLPQSESPADCIGWPEPGVQMRVDAPEGESVGELLMRSETRMIGYYGDPAATAGMLRVDGWVATGDLATAAADGSFRIVGRIKEMIIHSGFNVYPAEVEAALQELPQVDQAAVLGKAADDGDEDVVAFVCLKRGETVSGLELRMALSGRLAPYKIPGRIEIIDEMPLGPTGKIAKKILAARR